MDMMMFSLTAILKLKLYLYAREEKENKILMFKLQGRMMGQVSVRLENTDYGCHPVCSDHTVTVPAPLPHPALCFYGSGLKLS